MRRSNNPSLRGVKRRSNREIASSLTTFVPRKDMLITFHALKHGGLIVYPTETAFALGCDATNASAVRRVYALKGRPGQKPLATIAADITMVQRFFVLDGPALALARRHWPGPLTIILPVRDRRLRRVLGNRVGVRVSSHTVARELSRRLGRPVVSTSANRAGSGNCYSVACVRRQLDTAMLHSIAVEGTLPRRKASTVVEFVRNRLIIHRRGAVRISV